MTTLVSVFKKIERDDKTKFDNFYSSSKAEIIINESDIDEVFDSSYSTVISNIQKSLGKGSGCATDSVIDHTISISKYNPLDGNSYIKLPKELNHPSKGLINIQNVDDNQCFKWRIVRYLNPADCNPARITKADKEFAKFLDFKNIKFPVKVCNIYKIEINNSIGIKVFGDENMEKHPTNLSKKCCEEDHVDLLLIGEEEKRRDVLIKDFNTFMYDHILHRGRKHFCRYFLQAFRAEEILKSHIKDCFKLIVKQKIIMPKKGEYVKFKNYERKIKTVLIYADFRFIHFSAKK